MARRRSALPEGVGAITARPRCWSCDGPNPPAFLCPTCPKRETQNIRLFDHGWDGLRERDPEMARVLERNARAARQLAVTHESHPAYEETDREYIAAGMELMLWRPYRAGQPDPLLGWRPPWARVSDPYRKSAA